MAAAQAKQMCSYKAFILRSRAFKWPKLSHRWPGTPDPLGQIANLTGTTYLHNVYSFALSKEGREWNLYINKTLSQKTTCNWCSQPCGIVGGPFWYQVKPINVPDVVWIIFCLFRSEICLKGAHFMSLWPHVLPPLLDTAICIISIWNGYKLIINVQK